MKIIDFHQHLWIGESAPAINADPEAEEMLRQMDRNMIERVVLHAVDTFVFLSKSSKQGFIGNNEDVLRVTRSHPDRFVGSIYINPLDTGQAVETLKRYHGEGFKCVKMAPYVGYYPDDPAIEPVFEKIDELKLPVMLHCGGGNEKHRSIRYNWKCGHPLYLHNVTSNFPNIRFVIAHLADGWFQEAVSLSRMRNNVYLECSTQGPRSMSYNIIKQQLLPWFRLEDRVMWGHDNDPGWYDRHIKSWMDFLKETGKTQFSENMFYTTALNLLSLS